MLQLHQPDRKLSLDQMLQLKKKGIQFSSGLYIPPWKQYYIRKVIKLNQEKSPLSGTGNYDHKKQGKTKSRKPLFLNAALGGTTSRQRTSNYTPQFKGKQRVCVEEPTSVTHTVVISYDDCYMCPDRLDSLRHAWCVLQDDFKGLLLVTVHCVVVNDSYPHGFYKISTELNISADMFVVFVNRCRWKQDFLNIALYIRTNSILYWQFLRRCTQRQ